MNPSNLYEQDFNAWIRTQIHLLKQGKVSEIDILHLIDELVDIGKSHLNELENRFVVLIAYLLKWQFQADKQSSRWRGSISEQRIQIGRLLRKNPSLKTKMQAAINDAYPDALELAIEETQLNKKVFPANCPYTTEQLLDKQFYPSIR